MRLIVMIMLVVWPALALADDVPPVFPALYEVVGVASDDRLNIRAAPDARADIIGALAHDRTAVEVIVLSTAGRWALVNHGERSGWVAVRFLQRSEPVPGPLGFSARNLSCYGNEPSWSVQITDTAVQLATPDTVASYPVTAVYGNTGATLHGSNIVFFDWDADGVPVRSHIMPGICYDGMSDQTFGLHYIDNAFGHKGCCSIY